VIIGDPTAERLCCSWLLSCSPRTDTERRVSTRCPVGGMTVWRHVLLSSFGERSNGSWSRRLWLHSLFTAEILLPCSRNQEESFAQALARVENTLGDIQTPNPVRKASSGRAGPPCLFALERLLHGLGLLLLLSMPLKDVMVTQSPLYPGQDDHQRRSISAFASV
jgi:hypothetical protein